MLTPAVAPLCVLHPTDDDAARLARVDAAADRQNAQRHHHVTWLGHDGTPLGPPELIAPRPRDMDAAIVRVCNQLKDGRDCARHAYGFHVTFQVPS